VYLYHVLFVTMNICGIDSKKKVRAHLSPTPLDLLRNLC
jgi:hypothetical protein